MRTLLTLLIYVITLSTLQAQDMNENPPYYKRITLVVADIDKSLKIYQDILGFTINYRKESDEDSYSCPVFNIPKEAKISFATLDSPNQQRTLGLTEIKGVELPKYEGIHMTASVIRVNDLDATMDQITALGLKTVPPTTDSNDYATFKEAAFVDYDGHLIVLYEIQDN